MPMLQVLSKNHFCTLSSVKNNLLAFQIQANCPYLFAGLLIDGQKRKSKKSDAGGS